MDFQQPPVVLPPEAPTLPAIAPAAVAAYRRRWTEFLFGGELPASRSPLVVREGATQAQGALQRTLLTYEAEPGVRASGYLLRCREATGRRPGIVVFHQTTADTIDEAGALDPEPELHMGAQLAARGYVVFCPKNFIFGDGVPEGSDWWSRFGDESRRLLQRRPQWKGMAKMLWDGIRAVDLLAARADVDAARIGCIGHSLGGKEALFLAAFDERVKAAVSSDGGIGLSFSNWEAIWYLGAGIRAPGFDLENHQVLALVAPRAFLLVGGEYDNDRAWPFIASVLPLWKARGAPDAVGWFRHPDGHRWTPAAQRAGYEFLDRYLKPGGLRGTDGDPEPGR